MQRQLDIARELYNACLEERREAYRRGVRLNFYDQSYQLKDLRRDCPDVASVNFSMLQATCRRVQRSYLSFYRRCKSGEKPGYPRFKGRDRFDSITFPSYGDGCKLTDRLYLQGVGRIKVKLHRPLQGEIKTVTLKREGPHWVAIFTCLVPIAALPVTGTDVGIDVGLNDFATLDDGETISNPRHLRTAQAGLRRAHRALSRKKRGGRNWNRQRTRVAARHRKVRNARRDFHHKEARKLVDRFDAIYHERLNIRGMVRNRSLAKSISDAGWGQFFTILSGKAEEAGRMVVAVNTTGTSQTCLCGARVEKSLSVRWHECLSCGLSLPRDQVSAMLIKRLGHSRWAPTMSIDAVAQEALSQS